MLPGNYVRIIDPQHPRFWHVGTVVKRDEWADLRIIATVDGITETFFPFELQAVVWRGDEWVKEDK